MDNIKHSDFSAMPTLTNASGLKHLPLTSPQGGYFRSKILTTNNAANPLVSAASSLLAIIASLRKHNECRDTRELYQQLIHEIKAFETQAQTLNYRADTILISRYLLCSVLDETILATNWGHQSSWQKHKLLMYFHNEEWGGERFFVILERLCSDAVNYIDVLELIYQFLSLGYCGKFQFAGNKTELDKIVEKVYESIRWQRGNIRKDLLIEEIIAPETKTEVWQNIPFWLLLTFTGMLLVILYIGFNFMLGTSAAPLYQQLSNII